MTEAPLQVVLSAAAMLLVLSTRYLLKALGIRKDPSLKLPPGPGPLPIIGNLLDVPCTHLVQGCAALSETYGHVVYLDVLGQRIILLGSYEAAQELLNKRAAISSDRPRSVMSELCGLSPAISLLKQYGPSWRYDRRAFQKTYHAEAMPSHHRIHLKVTRKFLRKMLSGTTPISEQLRFVVATTTMQIVYGLELTELHDRYYDMVERIVGTLMEVTLPGRYFVDSIPILRFLPAWFPGAAFKRFTEKEKREIRSFVNTLFDAALSSSMNRNSETESMITQLLRRGSDASDHVGTAELDMIKNIAVTAYVGAVETMHSALEAFFMAMAMYPHVQKKAQAELDTVVGTDRLPDFSDCEALPYLNALVKEVSRWHVVAPLGMPHRTSEDTEYKGYHIPAGTVLVPNIWAMSRDVDKYPDPETFSPERFLDEGGKVSLDRADPADIVFGFGRRRCPGQHFADTALFILCASVLCAFNIMPPMGDDGLPVNVVHEMVNGHPQEYEYVLKPRSSCIEILVLSDAELSDS